MILDETQNQRDEELARLMGMNVEDVQELELCGQNSIRIFDPTLPEPKTASEFTELYRDYKYLDLTAYLRTLMMTSVERRHKELYELLRSTEAQACLDFGSGVGSHAIALCENGNEVTLLDVPGPLSRFAKMRLESRGHAYTFLSNDTELPRERFDVVVCTDVLEHVHSPVDEFKRIASCIKPGGIMHLQVSSMIKESSGHFKSSIENWQESGVRLLHESFETIGQTLYRKR